MPYGEMLNRAVPFLWKLRPKDNGKPMEVPEGCWSGMTFGGYRAGKYVSPGRKAVLSRSGCWFRAFLLACASGLYPVAGASGFDHLIRGRFIAHNRHNPHSRHVESGQRQRAVQNLVSPYR